MPQTTSRERVEPHLAVQHRRCRWGGPQRFCPASFLESIRASGSSRGVVVSVAFKALAWTCCTCSSYRQDGRPGDEKLTERTREMQVEPMLHARCSAPGLCRFVASLLSNKRGGSGDQLDWMVLLLVLGVNKGRRYVLPICIRSGARERPGQLQLYCLVERAA
jgi:hypothetical protein